MRRSSHLPAVSAIIPCYNAAAYLRESIASVLSQTYPVSEIIVVDDGSNDDSADIARRYGPPVRVIEQENRGESVARNRGIEESQGDWIAFLDADDVWVPSKLERQVAVIGTDTCCVHTNYRAFGEQACVVDFSSVAPAERYCVGRFLLHGNQINVSSAMVPRSLPVRFPEWTQYGEDVLYFLEVIRCGQPVLVPEPLTLWRSHRNSQSAKASIRVQWHETFDAWLHRNPLQLCEKEVAGLRDALLEQLSDLALKACKERNWGALDLLTRQLGKHCSNPRVSRRLGRLRWRAWLLRMIDRWPTVP